jgi:Phosphodiester glycosidase
MAALATLVVLGVPIPTAASSGPATASADGDVVETVQVDPGLAWTTIARERGPVRINVLAVDPARVRGVLSNDRIAGREWVSRMGRRVGAVAGVNGGHFKASGDPVGAFAIDGQLLSEPIDSRTALILEPPVPAARAAGVGAATGAAAARAGAAQIAERALIAPLRFRGRVTVNGRSREIDGIDRTRGLIPACGGRGGDVPTTRPNAVVTCTDASELVVLTPRYGLRPPREGGVEAIVRNGTVTRVRPPGAGPVPRNALLLTGTGNAATFLRNAALPRSRIAISLTLTAAGRRFALEPAGGEEAAVGAPAGRPLASRPARAGEAALAAPAVVLGVGPRLLRAGRVSIPAAAEGLDPPQAPSFFDTFVASRQPRTLAGVRPDGTLLLVTVDGRRPGWSVGMTLPEAARLMRSLGARDALNLDGGGSTTMTVRGQVVNRPSDRSGERPVGDGLFVMP